MSRRLRVYYYAIFGAIGGLLGWQISNLLGLSFSRNLYLSDVVVGAAIGFCIGFPIGSAEGIVTRNPVKALRSGLVGGALGLLAGALALPLGEILFGALGGGAIPRALGWAFFGLFIGLVEGVTGGAQMWKGALGGALGGFLGGLLLELTSPVGEDLVSGKAIGLVLMGAMIGAMIALIVVILSRVWLEVLDGKLKGTTFILDKFLSAKGPTAVIGSNPLKSEIVIPDPDISPQHAMMIGADTFLSLKDISLEGTFVEGRQIQKARLLDGNRIRMGNTTLAYHERR